MLSENVYVSRRKIEKYIFSHYRIFPNHFSHLGGVIAYPEMYSPEKRATELSSRQERQTITGDHHANVFFKHFSNFSNVGVMKKTFPSVQIFLKRIDKHGEYISG